jgi:class 3 adenylate cyclase
MTALHATRPHHRVILAVDIEGSSARTNTAKAGLRAVMYDSLEECLIRSGIRAEWRDPFVDRGDGILVLIHPVDDVPKTLLLSNVIPALEALLYQQQGQELRLRVVLHAGEVHYDARGCFGESLDVAFRLLDSEEVKERFRRSRAPLVLVVSEDIHRAVIRHGYDGIDQQAFVPAVYVAVAGQICVGWVHGPAPVPREPTRDSTFNVPRGPS